MQRKTKLLMASIVAVPLFPLLPIAALLAGEAFPAEPIEIGTTPQFVFDNAVVDNYWAMRYKRESVARVFHQPVKHEKNPLIAGDGGYASALRDDDAGLFRMWYQTWTPGVAGPKGRYAVAYAESKDGTAWTLPKLGLCEWKGTTQNNIVWLGIKGRRASSPCLLELYERDRRGFRYVMQYSEIDGMHLVGSHDGIHWDRSSDVRISPIHSDTLNSTVYDPGRHEYVMFCRAKHVYRAFGDEMIDTGESRRVARMAGRELWSPWTAEPQNILVPDELDDRAGDRFNCFYGMPTRIYAGVYWGFLWAFKMNSDIHTELAYSRDGFRFDRLPTRPKLIERGPEGAWDDGMVFGSSHWVEVGDEWWIYYAGWDGPHGTAERTPGIGLVRVRKEGFISMRGPTGGGVLVTRQLRWPGGQLCLNADAHAGEIRVRVSDGRRKVLPGFDYADCEPFTGDSVAHTVGWNGASIAALAGQVVRLEFLLKNADLYSFRSTGADRD